MLTLPAADGMLTFGERGNKAHFLNPEGTESVFICQICPSSEFTYMLLVAVESSRVRVALSTSF